MSLVKNLGDLVDAVAIAERARQREAEQGTRDFPVPSSDSPDSDVDDILAIVEVGRIEHGESLPPQGPQPHRTPDDFDFLSDQAGTTAGASSTLPLISQSGIRYLLLML